ncbi:hypothetical protein SAY87_002230 [Trapa incisa]|uniref:Uncharacterized protein n=1 Tax=Trapa incisa TaxID=236973 RepID=A0AAN7PUI5_9MYRT|nr:hypothetical protein SAY87_002230 [Trapa incisa]
MRSMVSSSSSKGIAAIVGVGPNLGRSIARKFAHEGYVVAILARRLSRFADEIARDEKAQVFAIRIDCSDSRLQRLLARTMAALQLLRPPRGLLREVPRRLHGRRLPLRPAGENTKQKQKKKTFLPHIQMVIGGC